MAFFSDTFVNKIDSKGRVSVPAQFRAELNGQRFHGIVALPTHKYPALQCGGLDWMSRLSDKIDALAVFSNIHDDTARTLFGDTKQLGFDADGRITLLPALLKHANLNDFAAFVGHGPIFEIWEPGALERLKDESRRRVIENGLSIRLDQDKAA
jgi:MraZ protein